MTFNLTKKRVGDCIDVTDFVANGSFASLKANVQYLDNASPDKFAVLVRTLDFNRNWNGDYVWVDKEAYHFLKKSSLIQGDLVLCNVGSVGIVFEVPDLGLPMTLGPNSVLCRTKDKDVIRQRFIYYFFLSSVGQALLEELSGGSTVQPKFNKTVLRNSEIDVPDLAHQDFIVRILGILDSKISTNAAISKTLESIAQTIFKSWFVDFDPVKAKMSGEKPVGMEAAIAALFPDSMEETEIGLIPSGWDVKPAADLFEVGIGRTPPRKEPQWFCKGTEGIPWVSIRDMGTFETYSHGTNEGLTQAAVDKFKVPVVPENTVLMSFKLTVGKLCISDTDLVTNEAIAHFKISQNSPLNPFYTYLSLSNLDMGRLDSTSSIGTATNSGVIKQIRFLVPPQELLGIFHNKVSPIFSQLKLLRKQTSNLVLLRDSLLPRLISGELQIPDEMLAS
jgi:type I restriction enzyme S subunit